MQIQETKSLLKHFHSKKFSTKRQFAIEIDFNRNRSKVTIIALEFISLDDIGLEFYENTWLWLTNNNR